MAGKKAYAPGDGRETQTGELVIIEDPRHRRSVDRFTTTDFAQWLMGKHRSPGIQQRTTVTTGNGMPHIHITRHKKLA